MIAAGILAILGCAAFKPATAQVTHATDPYAYPGQAASPAPYPEPLPPRQSVRVLFAQSLAGVLQSTLSAASLGLTQLLVGRISDWFARKHDPGVVSTSSVVPPYPAAVYPGGMPAQPPPGYTPTVDGDPAGYSLQAGVAYEVHWLRPDGQSLPIDPVHHVFSTGDRILVLLRPSLPGWIDVFNLDAAGRETLLDSRTMAGGELLTLGPYEFVDVKGQDLLRLLVAPCSSPQLIARTRSLINVAVTSTSRERGAMPGCIDARTRAAAPRPPTRTIRKVSQDDSTYFALDPVSSQELATGSLQPREIQIVLQHR